jgi:aspartate/methionine/tyrosine aminotransferase
VREDFALGAFLARWHGWVRNDLSVSASETLTLAALLAMAEAEDTERWRSVGLGYADPHGALWLRAAIAARHEGLNAEHISCGAGAQESLACVMRALLTPEDHAIVILPIYQPSEREVTARCAATGVALQERDGWRLDIARVAAAIRPETRLILMNFPNSPTGAGLDAETLTALVDLCRRHEIWLINDEVYRLSGGGDASPCPPVADLYERGVSVDALSKAFGLPGLRVGWVACQDTAFLARVLIARSGLSSCLAGPSEVLAHIALRAAPFILARNQAIARGNLDRLRAVLGRHPDLFAASPGTETVFAFTRYLGRGSAEQFATRLLRRSGVLVLPSVLWASALAEVPGDHLRFGVGQTSAATAVDVMESYFPQMETDTRASAA